MNVKHFEAQATFLIVFQAEVYAVEIRASKIQEKELKGLKIHIMTGSFTALQAINYHTIISKMARKQRGSA